MQELQVNQIVRSRRVNFRRGRIVAVAFIGSLALAGIAFARNQSVVTITSGPKSAVVCPDMSCGSHSGGHGGGGGTVKVGPN